MRRGLITLTVALAAALAAVPIGFAATGGTDPRGDVFGEPIGGTARADIVRATAGRTSKGQIKHTVTVDGSAADPSGDGLVPFIFIEIPDSASSADDSNGQSDCVYFIGRNKGRLGVFRCGYADRTGSARIVRTSGSTTSYTFSARAIGNPRSYDWAVVTRGPSTARGTPTRHDRLPSEEDVYVRHTLR